MIIEFSWTDIENIVEILEPVVKATDALQGNGCTISKVIPTILDLKEKLPSMSKPRFKNDIESFLKFLDQKTEYIFKEDNPLFDPIFCMASVLDPKQSLVLTDELYKLGKDHLEIYVQDQPTQNIATVQQVVPPQNRRRTISTPIISENNLLKQLHEYFALIDSGSIVEEDPLVFWDENLQRFPDLGPDALQILTLSSTSASPERIFSIAGLLSSDRRSKIIGSTLKVRTILCFNK